MLSLILGKEGGLHQEAETSNSEVKYTFYVPQIFALVSSF